jgi:hypothetical protein
VAVGIEDDSRVRAAVGALAGRAVVGSAGRERRGVEGVHLLGARRGEGDVRADVRRLAELEREWLFDLEVVADHEGEHSLAIVDKAVPEGR